MKTKNPNYKEELKIFKQRSKEIADPDFKKEAFFACLVTRKPIDKIEKKLRSFKTNLCVHVYDEKGELINPYRHYFCYLNCIHWIIIPTLIYFVVGFSGALIILNTFSLFFGTPFPIGLLLFLDADIILVAFGVFLADYLIIFKPFLKFRKQWFKILADNNIYKPEKYFKKDK